MTPKYRLLTEAEVSEWTGIAVRTLQSWRSRSPLCEKSGPVSDRIPFTKIGGKVRYREDLVLKYLEAHTVG